MIELADAGHHGAALMERLVVSLDDFIARTAISPKRSFSLSLSLFYWFNRLVIDWLGGGMLQTDKSKKKPTRTMLKRRTEETKGKKRQQTEEQGNRQSGSS